MPGARDLVFKSLTGLHETVFRASRGRLLGRAGGMPVVMLTTTGRRTGRPRRTMLTSPLLDTNRIVLVASKGGDPRHPAWFLNLRDDPAVEATRDGTTVPMTARVTTGAERGDLWSQTVAVQPRYGEYQEKTEREIPLIVLEPRQPKPR